MAVRPDADETEEWVRCPRCMGAGWYEKDDGGWCRLCLPHRHESGINMKPRKMTDAWHERYGQRPGKVRAHVEVRYVLDPRPGKGLD